MADKELGSLASATTLDGTETHYVVQGGNSRKTTGAAIVAITHNQAWSTITSTPTTLSGYGITDAQPLDSDLTAIAALTTTGFGRGFLEFADEAAFKAGVNLEIGTDVQAHDALLDAIAALTTASGDIVYATGVDAVAALGIGVSGQVLKVGATGLPEWGAAAGGGDMLASVYDPTSVSGDAFDMANMVEATDAKIMTAAERTKLTGVEAGADVTDAANVDAAGATMNTDTDVSANSWVLDEDDMASDSDTKVPTQQSVNVGKLQKVATRAAMAALDPVSHLAAWLYEAGREGMFVPRSGSIPFTDPQEGVFVNSDTADYYWERMCDGGVNPAMFGGDPAVGSDVTSAVQALVDFVAGSWQQSQGAFRYQIDLAKRFWKITSPIDLTNTRQPFMTIRDGAFFGSFSGTNTGKIMLDLSGGNSLRLINIGVYGDPDNQPGVGIFQCKADSDGADPISFPDSKQHKLINCWGSGYYTKSAWIGFASECSEQIGCCWINKSRSLSAVSGILCNNASTLDDYVGGVTSDFATIPAAADSTQSNICHNWGEAQFMRGADVVLSITSISKGNPAIVTVDPTALTNSGLGNDDKIYLYQIAGMTELNSKVYTVKAMSLVSGTFALYDEAGTSTVDSTSFGTFTSGIVWNQTGPALILSGVGDLNIDNGYFLTYGSVPIVYDLKNSGGNRNVRIKGQWEHNNDELIRFDLEPDATSEFYSLDLDILNANQVIGSSVLTTDGASGGLIDVQHFRMKISSMGVSPAGKIFGNDSQWSIKNADFNLPLTSAWDTALSFNFFSGRVAFSDTGEVRYYGSHVFRSDDNSASAGPVVETVRFSQSPAVSDQLGKFPFSGYNSTSAKVEYAAIRTLIGDPTAGDENGYLELLATMSGVESVAARFREPPGSNFTSMYLLVNSGGVTSFQPVTLGAADSGGTGYKALRVPN